MMIVPISTEEFADKIFRSERVAQKAIAARVYKGMPLLVQQGKSTRGGKPPYFVLWDTETNQPATGDNYENKAGILEVLPEKSEVLESRIAERIAVRESLSASNRAYPVVDCTLQKTDRKPADRAISELNQPATGDNHESLRATNAENSSAHQQRTTQSQASAPALALPTRAVGTIAMQRGLHSKSENFGAFDGNSKRLLNQPTTGESHEKNNSSSVQTTKSDSIAPSAPVSFNQAIKTAEKNAQERDNKRMDAVLDKVFGDSNVFSIIPCVSADGLPVSIQEPSARYEAESRLAEPNSVISIETQTATLPITPASQLAIAVNQDFHPESFDCQMHYVLRLIENQKLGKVCRSNALTAYFATVYIHESLRAVWESLTNNVQRTKFAAEHDLKGEIPARLKAEGNPKSMTGRKSTVPPDAVKWIIKKVHEWADDTAPVLTATRRRTDFLLKTLLEKHTGIVLSEKQVFTIVKNHNLRPLMDKPQGTAGKKIGKKKGTYPRLPVNSLWLMDGCVPELLYIRAVNGNYTKLTCIGIEDVGSRKLLGFREYYSESGSSSVNLFKQVMTENQFKKGNSEPKGLISPTLRPDKGSGFMTSMGACAFAIGKAYAEKYHFSIDFKEANAGSPTEKAHLESSWKSVHSTYVGLVQDHFTLLGKVDKTPIVSNFKRGIEMSALYLDITLEELRASGIGGEFMRLMNSRKRTFTEDNNTIDFVPDHRWARYLANLNDDDPILPPSPQAVFSADDEVMEVLNVFGYAKHDATVKPDMTIQYKVGYNVPRDLGFSVTRSTTVRVSEMPDGTGRLAIFTAKEKQTKTKHDFGAEFLGFATVKAVGGNQEKAKHIRAKKDEKMAKVLEIAKQETVYSLILKEVQPFLISFGSSDDQRMLDNLVAMKLTPELAKLWVEDICIDKQTAEIIHIEFKRFNFEARKRLQNILVLPVQKQRNVR